MNRSYLQTLERQRGFLLSQYARADQEEKVKLLVRIMDIDDHLEMTQVKKEKEQKRIAF
ncbi:hypothetical protein GGQ84_000880 [Desulfitispora alkaliphila]|uniref:hypothetical protein n=1 Tax=Desulfitispora alkaliphila TaxID=622674 RepID=UPI003D204BED